MAYDLALDMSTGDLLVQDRDLLLIDNAERVAQQIQITLRYWYGEWFLNTENGVPYLEYICVKNPNLYHVRQILTEAIESVEGVESVTDMTLTVDAQNRQLYCEYEAETSYGLITQREVLGYGDN